MSREDDCKGGLLFAVLTGVLLGAAVAALSTPKTGDELRSDIQTKVKELPSEFSGLLDEAKTLYHKAQDILAKVTDSTAHDAKVLLAEQKTKITAALKKATDKINELLSDNELV